MGSSSGRRGWMASAGIAVVALLGLTLSASAASPGDVVVNEVAWMGTEASSFDEWIELYNTTDQPIDVTNWRLTSDDSSPDIALAGTIPAGGFYLLERTDDETVSDIDADQIYTGNLSNSGESLTLEDAGGNVVSTANDNGGDWPAGDSNTYATMERIDPTQGDADDNWATNDGSAQNGLNADGDPIRGTPKAINSVTPTNGAPSCSNVSLSVDANTSGSVAPDCSDPDDDSLSYEIVDAPSHGTAGVQNGSLTYTPDADFIGNDAFTYRADDGQATSNTATVDVTVDAVATKGDGDPNDDGAVDAIDARICLQIANGVGSVNEAQRDACDVDGDGSVDRDDAEEIARATIGLASDLGTATWLAGLTLVGLALPLVLRGTSRSRRLLLMSPGVLGLSLMMTGCPGLIPALPDDAVGIQASVSSEAIVIDVQNMPNGGLAALEIEANGLTFDPDALRVTDIDAADGWSVLAREVDNGMGEVRLVAVKARGGTVDGRVLTLPLEPKPGFSRGAAGVAWSADELILGDATNAEITSFQTGTQP